MKIKKSQIEQIKEVLKEENGHSANHIRVEITKNIAPELFESKASLIKEAKKRGFKKGDKVIDAVDGKIDTLAEINFRCFKYKKGLELRTYSRRTYGYNYITLFSEGKWAKIIETITREEAENELGKTIID